ncbi:MAG: thiamine phosphate synthase [Verrucomicrobia bacterium]|jgi:hypothetical protein|nr:thiamine phosphate synthase [Verrucomicrobiota bacterium]
MRLEDALLYMILKAPAAGSPSDFCAAAIAGGVDVIHVSAEVAANAEQLQAVHDVCRRDDALLVVADDAAIGLSVEADGLHLSASTASVGQARATMGMDTIVGMSTRSSSDAILGLEVGADYLLHWEGTLSPSVFSGLPGAAGQALFAAGLSSVDDARSIVERGVYRICIESPLLEGGDPSELAAAYSRVLGRSM